MAVEAFVDEAELDHAQKLQAAPGPSGRWVVAQRGRQPTLGRQHHRFLGRNIDMLTHPGLPSIGKSDEHGAGRLRCGVEPDLGGRDPNRGSILVAVEGHLPGGGIDGQIGSDPVGLGTVGSERAERNSDESRIAASGCVEINREGAALDQHIGPGHQLSQLSCVVDDNRALAPVVGPMVQRSLRIGFSPGPRASMT